MTFTPSAAMNRPAGRESACELSSQLVPAGDAEVPKLIPTTFRPAANATVRSGIFSWKMAGSGWHGWPNCQLALEARALRWPVAFEKHRIGN
jgi:hypothetical protein